MISKSNCARMHPLHDHALQQVDPRTIYPYSQGNWKCDNCSRQSSVSNPYHCDQCSFDLCQSCIHGEKTLVHEHPLYFIPTSQQCYQEHNGVWQCDICEKASTELGQTQSYHCPLCEFDLCVSCFQEKSHPIHVHPLRLADMKIIYPQTNGRWECDVCGTTSRLNERYAYHCALRGALCDFDCCLNCFKERQSPLHVHPLVRADSHVVYSQFSGGWKCDNCGSLHMGSDDNKPWHCTICDFDLCNSCMRGERQDQGFDETGPGPRSFGQNRSTAANNVWAQREFVPPEPMDSTTSVHGKAVTNSETEQTTDFNEADECVVCLSKPRNATLVHGDTGHFCCCWQCAQTLKNRGDKCPICRAPIDHVIKQFRS